MIRKIILLLSIFISLGINGETGKVYLVVGSDTAIWDGLSLSQYDNRYFRGDLYCDPNGNAYTVMDTSFRNRFRDSYGTPMKMTWWMMAGNVFTLSKNCNIPIRTNITLYLMKKYHQNIIDQYDDQLTLHYHNYYWSDYNGDGQYYWNQGLDFNLNKDDYEETLMKYLIEDDVFPVSFRSGWHYMDNAWQAYQEKFIPFDMSNAYPAHGGDYNEPTNNIIDWSQSPPDFIPYHPNADNYQIPGDLKQWRLRSISFTNINRTRENLKTMFEEAAKGNDQMACFWSHLPQTDFPDNMQMIDSLAHKYADKYPDVKFVIIDGDIFNLPNVLTIRFREEEGAFLAGILSGFTSESKIVGFLGGMDIPVIHKFEAGFRAGVMTACPGCKVVSEYTGSFNDPALGEEKTARLYGKGADIVFHASGKCGLGAVEASKKAAEGHYLIGVDSNQDYMAPGAVLCSAMKRVDMASYYGVKWAFEGTFEGGMKVLGLKEKGVGISPMKYTKGMIPNKVLAELYYIIKLVDEGKLEDRIRIKKSTPFAPAILAGLVISLFFGDILTMIKL